MKHRLASLALVCALLVAASPARADETCVACHEELSEPRLRAPVMALRDDVHDQNGVACTGCHGGDPDEPTARAHDVGRGFVGRPDAVGTAQLCGRCHDGSTDAPAVLRAYRASRHARALAGSLAQSQADLPSAGASAESRAESIPADPAAATCTSCHGAHGVESVAELRGEGVERARAISVCVSCHSDQELMAQSGLPTDQARQWTRSAHGREVTAGNRAAPVCTTCHEPHRAAAGLAAVAACGRCHDGIREAFDRGPHRAPFERLGFLDCVECHGSHDVEPPTAAMMVGIDAVCARCHARGQAMFDTIRRIAALGPQLDRARLELARDDPRRVAIVGALHALDAPAFEASLEGFEPLAPPPPPVAPAPPIVADARWMGLAESLGIVLVALLGLALVHRLRRGA